MNSCFLMHMKSQWIGIQTRVSQENFRLWKTCINQMKNVLIFIYLSWYINMNEKLYEVKKLKKKNSPFENQWIELHFFWEIEPISRHFETPKAVSIIPFCCSKLQQFQASIHTHIYTDIYIYIYSPLSTQYGANRWKE